MSITVSGLYLICIFALVITVVQLIRLSILSSVVRHAIDDTFERRMSTIGTNTDPYQYPYPDIDATYSGLKWYKPWERPSTLLVYDKNGI